MKKIVLCSVLVFLGIGLSACGSGDSSTVSSLEKTIDSLKTENSKLKSGQGVQDTYSDSSTAQSSDKQNASAKGINEESIYKSGDKDALSIKVIEASTNQSSFPSHMVSLDDYDTTNMVAVKFEFKNINLSEDYGMNPAELTAYDASGNAYKIVNQQSGQDYVANGRSSTSQFYWEVPNAASINEIEIDYSPSGSSDIPKTTFKVPVSH